MSTMFLNRINEKNLCTWYILPLLELNISSFVECNFSNSYMTKDGKFIVVEVNSINYCPQLLSSRFYQKHIQKEKSDLIVFEIPNEWESDVQLYLTGRYSRLSNNAKKLIRLNSGLAFKVDTEWGKWTDAILLALEKHPALREQWIIELTHTTPPEFPEDLELLSIPSESTFIDMKF